MIHYAYDYSSVLSDYFFKLTIEFAFIEIL